MAGRRHRTRLVAVAAGAALTLALGMQPAHAQKCAFNQAAYDMCKRGYEKVYGQQSPSDEGSPFTDPCTQNQIGSMGICIYSIYTPD